MGEYQWKTRPLHFWLPSLNPVCFIGLYRVSKPKQVVREEVIYTGLGKASLCLVQAILLLLEVERTVLFSLFIWGQTEDMSIACSSWRGGTWLGDNGHNVAAGCQGWERGPGKEITSKPSNTRPATISPYPLLPLFYISNWLNITCIFFDYRIWHHSISHVNYYDFAVKPFLTYLCVSKSETNEYTTNLRFFFWNFFVLLL